MKILLDENVAQAIKSFIESAGHDVSHIRPKGLSLKNGAVYQKAKESFDLFVTNDRDFLKKTAFPPTEKLGVIFLRVSMSNPENQVQALKNLFSNEIPDSLRNKLVIVRSNDYEFR